ncbi:MAG TPA: hypothetical protein VFH34_02305 [Anaerolineales bacterium]|nr:hypothetical protein [Anaerolineales bacterium]
MIYHLSSQTAISRQKFSRESWVKVLSLALFYGWQPMGTRVPSMTEIHGFHTEHWDGSYLTNDGQIVARADALALGRALERSLDDIPDFNLDVYPLDLDKVTPFAYFAGDEKQQLVEFIKFCRLGSFLILRI